MHLCALQCSSPDVIITLKESFDGTFPFIWHQEVAFIDCFFKMGVSHIVFLAPFCYKYLHWGILKDSTDILYRKLTFLGKAGKLVKASQDS